MGATLGAAPVTVALLLALPAVAVTLIVVAAVGLGRLLAGWEHPDGDDPWADFE